MASGPEVLLRAVVLFILGVSFFCVCDLIQGVRGGILDPELTINVYYNPNIWIPVACGLVSVVVGLLSPLLDSKLGSNTVHNEWSSVLRCVAFFLGYNHITAKIDFTSYLQLSFIALGLSIGLWWFFDGSRVGFGFGMILAVIAMMLNKSITWRQLVRFSNPIMSAWIPCLFFSGGVTVALVGRQLANSDILTSTKQKKD